MLLGQSDRPFPRVGRWLTAGAVFGLSAFAVESALILRSGAIGLTLETEGPFAALFAAARAHLLWLLARILLVYVGGGALLGLAAGALSFVLGARRHLAVVAFVAEWVVLASLLSLERALLRPALFDDVGPLRPLLAHLVDEGEPSHVGLLLLLWLGAHLAVGLASLKPRGLLALSDRRPHQAIAAALGIAIVWPLTAGSPPTEPFAPEPADASQPRPSRPKLVVLYGIDAFRPDRLAAYGGRGDVAPNLERFLEDATRFDRAYTPIAQTDPAWRSLSTARWPTATGVRHPLTPAHAQKPLPTFVSALARAGMKTIFATDCSRFHFEDEKSGFEVRWQPPRGAVNFAYEKLRYRLLGVLADNAIGAAIVPELIDNRGMAGIHDPYGYARRLAERAADAAEEGPTLFAFHSTAAHFPGDPVYPHYRRFVSRQAPLARRLRMFFAPVSSGESAQASKAEGWGRAESEALYDELLSQADAQLGIFLGELERRGLYRDALIIVFSDHGESFHPDMPELHGATPVHGARLTDDEYRVLLAIKPPGGRSVEHVEQLVRLVDVGPTVLSLMGLAPLPDADGVSVAPLLSGEPMPPLMLYAETGFTHVSPDVLDPSHRSEAPRNFTAYRVRPDGVVEMTDEAHRAAISEKHVGAFDGQSWLIRIPLRDGSVREVCRGTCNIELRRFLDRIIGRAEDHG